MRLCLTIALLLGAALAGAAARPDTAFAKDTLVLGMAVEPSGLDPTAAAPTAIREVTWGNLFEGLVTVDEKGNTQPLLATSWSVSPDGLVYTFKLRPGVVFHNGTPFDSAVVKFSLDRARAPDSTNAQKQFFTPIDHIDTPDPLTAVVTLRQPSGLFVYHLAWGDAAMVDPKTVATNKTEPVGTGPFRFSGWQRGSRITLVRNEGYWDRDRPKMAAVTFRFIGDPQAAAAALRAGDIDALPELTAPELFKAFAADPRFKASVGATPRKLVAGLNNARSPLDQPKVRQALMSAIDRRLLVEAAYAGYGTPIGSHYAPTDPGYVDSTGVWPYDPGKAKALLAEAGFAGGLALTIKAPQMSYTSRTAEVLQAMLAEVGVTLTVEPSEFPAKWIDEVFVRHDFAMTVIDHAEPRDIEIYARPNYYFGYRNPAFDAVIAEADKVGDGPARNALMQQAQAILAADVPALYLFDLPRLGVRDARLQGLWRDEPIPQMLVRDARWAD